MANNQFEVESRTSEGRRSQVSVEDREVTNLFGDSWKSFDSNSEAGRILRRLYAAGKHNAPLVKYPKVRRKKNAVPPGQEVWGRSDPTKGIDKRERERKLVIPKPTKPQKPNPAPILSISRRKNITEIQKMHESIEEDRRLNHPRARKAVSTEMEKRRLAMQFQFKGGKALPENGTSQPIEGHIPLSLITGKPTRLDYKQKEEKKKEIALLAEKKCLENDFDSVAKEVESLRQSLDFLGPRATAKQIAHLRSELKSRVDEMQNINDLLNDMRARDLTE